MTYPDVLNRRQAIALLDVTYHRFKILIEAGVIPPGIGMGPRSLRWSRDELLAIREGARRKAA